MMYKYSDILSFPHHRSAVRPHMKPEDRAAQFAAFQALTGYGDEIDEAARLTDSRPELSDEQLNELNEGYRRLEEIIKTRPETELLVFVPDEHKQGGRLVTVTGKLRAIDEVHRVYIFEDKRRIAIDSVVKIKKPAVITAGNF